MTQKMTQKMMTNFDCGPCGPFRYQVVPDVRVGVVHLERQRPWPEARNPETGRLWGHDMKDKIFEVKFIFH
jgi:hypothetical protein